jgi:alpha-tubulin suppressor-like RCC1 family protein
VGGNVIFAASPATITAISADIGYTCAATNDGAAWCWGGNSSGVSATAPRRNAIGRSR